MDFYLGTHLPHWLEKPGGRLFVSRRTIGRLRKGARARRLWAMDSGGFSELSMYGHWTITPEQYVEEVRQHFYETGNLEWAAIQDWMCEPFITSKTMPTIPHKEAVRWHQVATVESWLTLTQIAPEMPWAPVLQGWTVEDYGNHVRMYDDADPTWRQSTTIGVGSVCRREGTITAEHIFRSLASQGLGGRLHAFGAKIGGVSRYADVLGSSDSLAWSSNARYKREPICSPKATHKTCANCILWAEEWRQKVLDAIARNEGQPRQQCLL